MTTTKKGKEEEKEISVVYFRTKFSCSQSAQSVPSILRYGRLSIVRNLQEQSARFHRRACAQIYCMRVEQIKITVRSAAIAPKITVRELVSRARVYRTNARVHTRRAKMVRKERKMKESKRASEKEGKRRGKGKRLAERSFASRVRSWRANV